MSELTLFFRWTRLTWIYLLPLKSVKSVAVHFGRVVTGESSALVFKLSYGHSRQRLF